MMKRFVSIVNNNYRKARVSTTRHPYRCRRLRQQGRIQDFWKGGAGNMLVWNIATAEPPKAARFMASAKRDTPYTKKYKE